MATEKAQQACPVCKAELDPGARYCGGCGTATVSTETAHASGPAAKDPGLVGKEVAGRYRILAKLGEGGMGAVYRAEQISLKRRVALKVLKPELSSKPGLVRRFNAEAELAAKLNHPNTVTLYDFGQDEQGALFIAMEFIEGRSMREVLVREGPQSLDRIVAIGKQICSSLSDAHATGIVHRDLKPDNVMLSERGKKQDVVTVLDFGIAKLRDEEGNITQQPMTRAGDMLGTPQYMAPEQIRGERVDARTDVYALGVILYEMVTARLPFEAASVMALLSKHLTEAPIPPHKRRTDLAIEPKLEQLIMRCLAKSPEERPPTMDAVEDALVLLGPTWGAVTGSAAPSSAAGQIPPTVLNSQHPPSTGPGYPSPAPGHASPALGYASPAPGYASPAPGAPGYASPAPGYASPAPGYASPAPGYASDPGPHSAHSAPTPVLQAAPRRRRSWLVPLLVLMVLGAGAAGAYFAFVASGDEDEEDSEEDGFDMSEWTSHNDSAESSAPRTEEAPREIPRVPSNDTPDHEKSRFNYAGGGSFVDPLFSYGFDVPAGFAGGGDDEGSASYIGQVNGHQQTIITTAWSESGRFNEDQIEEALALRISLLGLTSKRLQWKTIHGHRTLQGRVRDGETSEEGDFVLMRRAPVFYFVIVGGDPDSYRATEEFRRDFFEKRFRTNVD